MVRRLRRNFRSEKPGKQCFERKWNNVVLVLYSCATNLPEVEWLKTTLIY